MSVKPLPFSFSRATARFVNRLVDHLLAPWLDRLLDGFLDGWWVEWLLMLFIVGTMVYNHVQDCCP